MLSTTFNSIAVRVIPYEPERSSPVTLAPGYDSARSSGLSRRETRVGTGSSLTWRYQYTALLSYADSRQLRAALRSYANEPVVVPVWEAATDLGSEDEAPLSGGLRIVYEPDWSLWELHESGDTPAGAYSAAAQTAPALWGRFDALPKPQANTDELAPVAFSFVERGGPAAYAVAPRDATVATGPTLHGEAQPLLDAWHQYDAGAVSGGIELRVQRQSRGYGRSETADIVAHAPASTGTLRFLGSADDAMRLIALFAASRGNVSAFWWRGAHAEWRLAADASSGSADIVLEEAPLAPPPAALALRHADGSIVARSIVDVDGTTVTLSSAPGDMARRSTTLLPLYYGRFDAAEIELDWTDPANVSAEIPLVELPAETEEPEGETVGSSLGDLGDIWHGYVVTDEYGTEYRYTSHDAIVDAGETALGVFLPIDIKHGDIVQEINLARHDVSLEIGAFAASPFERARLDPFAPKLTVSIYEGQLADPENAKLLFSGRVSAPRYLGETCSCQLVGLAASLQLRGPVAVASPRCWTHIYSPLCGLDRDELAVECALVGIDDEGRLIFGERVTPGKVVERSATTTRPPGGAGNVVNWTATWTVDEFGDVSMDYTFSSCTFPTERSKARIYADGSSDTFSYTTPTDGAGGGGSYDPWPANAVAFAVHVAKYLEPSESETAIIPAWTMPDKPADWYRMGYAERTLPDGSVQRYRIAGSSALTSLYQVEVDIFGELRDPPSSFPDPSWRLVPGCSKSWARCGEHGNQDSFRGHPRFPSSNPALTSVKQETPRAAKK